MILHPFGYDGDMKALGGGARTTACLDLSQPFVFLRGFLPGDGENRSDTV